MTIEEKRAAIEKHCNNYEYCRASDGNFCILYDADCDDCLGEDNPEMTERNFKILSERGLIYDIVDKAEHYNKGGIECIEAIKASMSADEYAGFLKGQVIKYVWRYRHKGKPVEDLKKARYYLDKLIGESEAVDND